jgi:hypothetical protein
MDQFRQVEPKLQAFECAGGQSGKNENSGLLSKKWHGSLTLNASPVLQAIQLLLAQS